MQIKLRAGRRFGEVSRELEKANKWDNINVNDVDIDKQSKEKMNVPIRNIQKQPFQK